MGDGLEVSDRAAGIVCDVGAGVVEIGAVCAGRLAAHAAIPLGTRDYLDDPEHVLPGLVDAFTAVLRSLPGTVGGDLAATPIRLLGGGALLPGLAEQVASRCRTG